MRKIPKDVLYQDETSGPETGTEPSRDGVETVTEPSLDEVEAEYGMPPADRAEGPKRQDEIVALIGAVFDGVSPKVYDNHKRLCAQMAVDLGANFWLTPTQERMPFPEALLYAIGSALRAEKRESKRIDWLLWLEDDIAVPQTLYRQLRVGAHPTERPFIGVCAFDRNWPFQPTVWGQQGGEVRRFDAIPSTGLLPVSQVGMTVALMHRSLFDKIPQPWFGTSPGKVIQKGTGREDVKRSIKPDMWFCQRMRDANIPIYVNFGVRLTHFGQRMPVNRETAPLLRGMEAFNRDAMRRYCRGEL
jgi:hypothetical protein